MAQQQQSVQRVHAMPFGAEMLDDGSINFRLWAPAAQRVEVCLQDGAGERILPLQLQKDGWFSLATHEATAGAHYCFSVDGGMRVPDPASRYQPQDVHGPSEVVDPRAWQWADTGWQGRPWEEAVFYELHVGSFTPQGSFVGVAERLDHLVDLGVTAIELMPVADFPGVRNWGYDGVLPYAPDASYGRPEELKALVQAAHAKGLMVFLDVVYNHFGPEGNYLHAYAPQFFSQQHHTPWGAAINFDGVDSGRVRDFFIHNALYWLEEYHLDGLRLDAVHAILDNSSPDFLTELAQAVARGPGATRHVHLVLENDDNAARYLERDTVLKPRAYVAQWNDDIHHALHVLASGEQGGYYADYADVPARHLGRCLTEGFAYQNDPSPYRDGALRGEPSRHLPVTAFVTFLQNHDQIGNRAFGERLTALATAEALRAVTAVVLLAPSPPLLFMGQEWGSRQPFPFFCDFGPELAEAVTAGRRREFERFPEFSDPAARARIPDPCAVATFDSACLDWAAQDASALQLHRALLALRQLEIAPRLAGLRGGTAGFTVLGDRALCAHWLLGEGSRLVLLANLGAAPVENVPASAGRVLYTTDAVWMPPRALPPWSVCWHLEPATGV
ncbi:MAG: malto-oligosyltrehalose trehalohydrolase [Gammaproteobacteria bacterium]|nr:malto-oligosyltrehalose trehalohydrolase [Gammaproteobacteria bacterium]